MTQLDNLHNIISRSADRLHVLVFHICLYNFSFFANHSHFLGELRFQNDPLHESLDHGNLTKYLSRIVNIAIFDIIATLRRVYDTYGTNK